MVSPAVLCACIVPSVLAALVVIYMVSKCRKKQTDNFVSNRAMSIYNDTKPLFDQNKGSPRYSEYH